MPETYLKGDIKRIPDRFLDEDEIKGYSQVLASVDAEEHEHFRDLNIFRGVINFYLTKESGNDQDNYLKISRITPNIITDPKQDYAIVVKVALKYLEDESFLEDLINNYVVEKRLEKREQ